MSLPSRCGNPFDTHRNGHHLIQGRVTLYQPLTRHLQQLQVPQIPKGRTGHMTHPKISQRPYIQSYSALLPNAKCIDFPQKSCSNQDYITGSDRLLYRFYGNAKRIPKVRRSQLISGLFTITMCRRYQNCLPYCRSAMLTQVITKSGMACDQAYRPTFIQNLLEKPVIFKVQRYRADTCPALIDFVVFE